MKLQVQRLRREAVLPDRAYAGDAGLDLVACERVTLAPGERASVGTGLAVAIPQGHAGFVQPRSGLAAQNGVTHRQFARLDRCRLPRRDPWSSCSTPTLREPFTVEPGMRIAQLVLLRLPEVETVEVDALPESERGERGFGSSAV